MKQIWKKVLVFVMVIGTITTSLAQTDTRATLFVAGFVETLARIFIIPRQDTASNIDMTGVTTTTVADFFLETNTDQNFTVNAWSVNGNSGLCDGTQPNGGPVFDPTSAVGGANCLAYQMTWTTVVTDASVTAADTGAVTLGQGSAGSQVIATYTTTAGTAAGIQTGTIEIDPAAPGGTLPAGRYDDTIVFQLVTP